MKIKKIKIKLIFFIICSFMIFIILFFFIFIKNKNYDKKLYISINNIDVTSKYIQNDIESYPKKIKIETEYGYNDLLLYEDKIACTNSNCKDKICINRKFIYKIFDNEMIICAPHKLIIYYK